MFEILKDGLSLWNPRDQSKRLLSPTLSLEVNRVGSLSFKILPGHESYNALFQMRSIVTVLQDDRTVFKGRIYSVERDFRNIKTVTVEGLLGYFNDSIVRPYEFSGGVSEYLASLISQHNDQVEPAQRFKLGRVTVVDNNDYITRSSSDCPTTWKEINDKLIERLGGYIVIRYEADGNYIDYLADYGDTSTQDIAFSVNLLDLTRSASSDTLITCVIPYGAEDEETGNKIDITSVNGGVDYISAPEAVAVYGKIFEVVEWPDVTLPANLLTKARAYLAERTLLPDEIEIRAVDLHLADETVESFKLGDYIRVLSAPHDLDERVLLTAYEIDLADPVNCTITLNLVKKSYLQDAAREESNRLDVIRTEVGAMVTAEREKILAQTQTYVNDTVENSKEFTRTLVADYVTTTTLGEYKQEVASQFSQSAEALSLTFTEVNDRITEENGDINRQLTNYGKYFRFTADGLEIGKDENSIKLTLDNGSIQFSKNGVVFGYWDGVDFHTGNIVVEVNERAQFGNFAFIPRSDGSLMFLKVGG